MQINRTKTNTNNTKKKTAFQRWLYKPRKGFIFGLSEWILTEPQALNMVLFMAHILSCVIFGLMFWIALVVWGLVAKVILGVIFLLTLWNLLKFIRINKKSGGLFQDIGIKDMVFGGKK